MSETPSERAERWSAFRRMSAAGKLQYIVTYYKLPIVLTLLIVYVLSYGLYRQSVQREILLYAACANVSVGGAMEEILSGGFVRSLGGDAEKSAVYLYQNLYLSDHPADQDHEYAYASRLKLLSAINVRQLDVVLMNREAYDFLSGIGYLAEIPDCLSGQNPDLCEKLRPFFVENRVIREDNALEYSLGEADEYHADSVLETNGVVLSAFPVFQEAGFSDTVYLGILPNTPRPEAVAAYLAYLTGSEQDAA